MKFAILVVAIVGLSVLAWPSGPSGAAVAGVAPSPEAQQIISAINAVRAGNGLTALSVDPRLDAIAGMKVADMCRRNYWSHNDPNGRSWLYFYKVDGYSYKAAGENLAEGFASVPTLMSAWVNSPEHYANIVNSHYTKTGVAELSCASYQGQTDAQIVAQEFAG